MKKQDITQRKQTDKWFKQNGIQVHNIYVGTTELFQATKLATVSLKEYGRLLNASEAHALNEFLKRTRNQKLRTRITQGQCWAVMNITKCIQRRAAQAKKRAQRRGITVV